MVVANSAFHPGPIRKSVPASELRVLCVSAFSSPNFSSPDFKLSTFNRFSPISFRIRTSGKHSRNPIGMSSSKTKHLKLFRMSTYKKTGEGGPTAKVRSMAFGNRLAGYDSAQPPQELASMPPSSSTLPTAQGFAEQGRASAIAEGAKLRKRKDSPRGVPGGRCDEYRDFRSDRDRLRPGGRKSRRPGRLFRQARRRDRARGAHGRKLYQYRNGSEQNLARIRALFFRTQAARTLRHRLLAQRKSNRSRFHAP